MDIEGRVLELKIAPELSGERVRVVALDRKPAASFAASFCAPVFHGVESDTKRHYRAATP
jgi:hypothetical protein